MTDKTEKIKYLLDRLKELRKVNVDNIKNLIENWKEEVIEILDENQRIRFIKLKFYDNAFEHLDDDLPF